MSKMYDESWMAENGFVETPPDQRSARDLLVALGREGKIMCLLPDDTLQHAADTFRERGISQMPVLEEGKMVGAVQEITIVHALHRGADARNTHVREVMARAMPEIDVNVSLEEVYRLLLSGNPAVAVSREGRLAGLITRSDLMLYYDKDNAAKA
jgi:cystathionine beta-synthase